MRRLLITLFLFILLATITVTAPWWLPWFLAWVITDQDQLQMVTTAIQFGMFLAAGLVLLLGIRWSWKGREPRLMTWQRRPTVTPPPAPAPAPSETLAVKLPSPAADQLVSPADDEAVLPLPERPEPAPLEEADLAETVAVPTGAGSEPLGGPSLEELEPDSGEDLPFPPSEEAPTVTELGVPYWEDEAARPFDTPPLLPADDEPLAPIPPGDEEPPPLFEDEPLPQS